MGRICFSITGFYAVYAELINVATDHHFYRYPCHQFGSRDIVCYASDILTVGSKAPAISLPDQDRNTRTLDEFNGTWVVLYFYPKDNTPGCTKEACGFRDVYTKLQKTGAAVIGISCDSEESHTKFVDKFNLPFPLLADTEKKTVEDYGVWKEKNNYGKKYFGIARTTFLIDPEGNIAKIYKTVKTDSHHEQVLTDMQKFVGKTKN